MNKQIILITTLFFCILPSIKADSKSADNSGVPTISVIKLDINEEALNLVYEIRNDSEDDAWIFVGGYQLYDSTFGMGVGVLIAEDGQTLTIRARSKMTRTVMTPIPIYSRLVRLRCGDRLLSWQFS